MTSSALLAAWSWFLTGAGVGFVVAAVAARVVGGRAAREARTSIRLEAADDLARVVDANRELRAVTDLDVLRNEVCRLAARLAGGAGAVLYLQGPGLLVPAGRAGRPVATPGLRGKRALTDVLRDGRLVVDAEAADAFLPLSSGSGAFGVVHITGTGIEDRISPETLRAFAETAGAVFERFGDRSDPGHRDPATGVSDRQHGAAAISSLRPDDGVLVCEIDGIASLSEEQTTLVMGQLALHLRDTVRPGDVVARNGEHSFLVVLRALRAPVEVVVERLVHGWTFEATFSIGATIHRLGRAPIATHDEARELLGRAQETGRGQVLVHDRSA